MSSRMVGMVLERYPLGGGEKLLAVLLADHAHDDGTHIYPYVASLAAKSCQSERTVQRQLEKMVCCGFLLRLGESHGGRGRATRYRINPAWIAGGDLQPIEPEIKGDKLTPFAPVDNLPLEAGKGDIAASPIEPERVTSGEQKGDIAVSPAIEPSKPNTEYKPPNPPRGAESNPANRPNPEDPPLLSLVDWLEQCEARGEPPIPPDHPVHAYASASGISPAMLALAWAEWQHQRRNVAKRKRRWADEFELAVRNGHMRLWFLKPGETQAQLTTQGRAARAFHGEAPPLRPGDAGPAADHAEPALDPALSKLKADAEQWKQDQAGQARAAEARRAAMAKLRAPAQQPEGVTNGKD